MSPYLLGEGRGHPSIVYAIQCCSPLPQTAIPFQLFSRFPDDERYCASDNIRWPQRRR